MRLKILYLLIIVLTWQSQLTGQAFQNVLPKSFAPEHAALLDARKSKELPAPDLERILIEDRQFSNNRFAYPVPVDFDWQDGTWTQLENGDRVWRLSIEAPEALGLAVFFDEFYLPKGSTLHLYTPDRQSVIGAYTNAHNPANGKFWIGFTQGTSAVLEYYEPRQVFNQGRIHLFRVDYAYQKENFKAALRSASVMELGFGTADECNDNINCPEGQALQIEKKAICRILLVVEEGTGFCTGNLINNVREDNTPYILSAFHCQDGFTPLFDFWRFDFNFEGSDCTNPTEEPTYQSLLGCVQRAGRQQNDFLLLELNNAIPSDFDAYFLGWNRSTSVPSAGKMIHHPRGDVKKVSSTDQAITVFNRPIQWNNEVTTPALFHFDVTLTQGTFEVGSSGGALLDQDNRIVGQLHGGSSNCESSQAWFGRLALAWEGGNSADNRLRDWLDPDNTGVFNLNGKPNVNESGAAIIGIVTTDAGDPVPNVQIQLLGQSGLALATFTDEQGVYTFENVPIGDIYQINPFKDDEANNGLSVLDLIQVRKHILNLEGLNSPYQIIAADVNASNSVSTLDLILIQKVILGIDISFSSIPLWTFLPADVQFVSNTDPFQGITAGSFQINLDTQPDGPIVYDIIGIKSGDVNNSAKLKP